MNGEIISHYRLLEKLGSGGMGVVYAAEDIKLGRKVALKFLPVESYRDPIALHRFEREARAVSALNHPNICTIFEVDEFEGHRFIAMELLKGMTMRDRIAGEALRREDLLDFGIQITNGLDAAHSEGIIHRDIKPANVFVTANGYIKILDFGLAKLTADSREIPETPEAATASTDAFAKQHLTTPGTPLGTVAYMSPEQALGEKLDARTDLFSFGAVFYEMATGRQAFMGNTSAGVVDAILHKNPLPIAKFNPEVAPELQLVINKALEKDRKLRYQTASDIRADLQRVKRDSDPFVFSATPAVAPVKDVGTSSAPAEKSRKPHGKRPSENRSRILIVGAVAMAILLAVVAVARWLSPGGTAEAYLDIRANPGAQLLIDDKPAGIEGNEGATTVKVSPGVHSVRVNLDGYESWSESISVKAGGHLAVVTKLNTVLAANAPPAPSPSEGLGTMLVQSNDTGAEVFVDGQPVGVTGRDREFSVKVDPGRHRIQLKKSGYMDSPETGVEIALRKSSNVVFRPLEEITGGTTYSRATVNVAMPLEPRIDFGPVDSAIVKGHQTKLKWSVENATEVSIDQGIGKVPAKGEREVTPNDTTTYTLTAKWAGAPKTATAKVTMNSSSQPIIEFKPTDATLQKGQSTKLTWNVQNATEVSIDPGLGKVPTNGEIDVSPPDTTTYTLTASGPGGNKVASVKIFVMLRPPGPEDVHAIRVVLNKYSEAAQMHNAGALKAVWPSIDMQRMSLYMNKAVQASILEQCTGSPKFTQDGAEWTCDETVNITTFGTTPEPVSNTFTVKNTFTFKFKRLGDSWQIEGVEKKQE